MEQAPNSRRTSIRELAKHAALLGTLLAAGGCTPSHYRLVADRETYGAIAERLDDSRWRVPQISIEPAAQSRIFDPFDPDHPPQPPDDPGAHRYLHLGICTPARDHWHDDGDAPWIESPAWRESLELSDDGTLTLTPEGSIELGVTHSREYQRQLEELYLAALVLTLERFEFQLHWFGGNDTTYRHAGGGSPGESNTLTTASNLGFSRSLSRGGQVVVDLANSFVWEFTGRDRTTASSLITINFVQPLLRLAGREVRLEQLRQAERNVLYAVRDFARFRKQYYVDVMAGNNGYLQLLLQLQNIRNQDANLISLEQNLLLHEALAESEQASGIQVDQVFQSYQAGRLSLLQAQSNLETSLDSFKLTLGLPPTLPVDLSDSLLDPFRLSDPAIEATQEEIERFLGSYRELDEAPPVATLRDGFVRLKEFRQEVSQLVAQVRDELQLWRARLDETEESARDATFRRKAARAEDLARQLGEVPLELDDLTGAIERAAEAVAEETRREGWETLQELAGDYLELLAELFTVQTEIRVYLIELRPVQYGPDEALGYALANRLDLMNERARVVDAWRAIRISANSLKSDLDVVFDADIATEPFGSNPLSFAAANSSYSLGLRFDAPLNRKAESNNYRASLVNYQRARRAYMALEDQIQQAVRRDLRQLETDRLNFDIARESLVVAARQVEQTRDQLVLVSQAGDSSTTQDVLNALNALLQARNSLIGIWVSYETNRLQLLLDMEAMQLDDRGIYSSDERILPNNDAVELIDPFAPGADDGGPYFRIGDAAGTGLERGLEDCARALAGAGCLGDGPGAEPSEH